MLIVVSKYLATVEQLLTTFSFQNSCVLGKISIRWSKNKHKITEAVQMLKILMVKSFFSNVVIDT